MNGYNDNLHGNSKASAYENARTLRKGQTMTEQILWRALRNSKVCNLKFRRQRPFDNYILDFYNHKMRLAIEVDEDIHNHPEVAAYDAARTRTLNDSGITVLRFTNVEVQRNLNHVITSIEDWVNKK